MSKNKETMDSISLPDKDKINHLDGGFADSRRVYKERSISDFTNAVKADFSEAAPIKVPERTEPKKELDEMEKLIEERKKAAEESAKTPKKKKGIKVGKHYVARWLVKRIAIICIISLLVLITFFPPFVFSTDEGECLRVSVLGDKSLPQLKEDILANWTVYNIDNLSTEKPSNYRVCSVKLDIKNFTPYSIEIPSVKIVSCDPMYRDKFVAARIVNGTAEIGMFSVKTITVEVLLNVVEINEDQFDEAMTSLILRTNGMKKKAGPVPIPVAPAYVFVSDALEYRLESSIQK